jgi:hypothetical protein
MKKFIILVIITFFEYCPISLSQSISDTLVNFLSLENKEVRVKSLNLKSIFKGIYYYLEKDSANEDCCKNIYYLIDVKIINHSDSITEFIVYDCTVAENIVTDTKELQVCINSCTSNATTIIKLMPNQEFSVPVIFKSKNEINFKVRIGFIIISPKNVWADEIFSTIVESLGNFKNVLWSDPINIGLNYGHPFEIK